MGRTEYHASQESPYTNSQWLESGDENDADFEFEQSNTLINLRRNSSQLIKNNPIAFGIQQNIINSVLGGTITDIVTGPRNKLIRKYLMKRGKKDNLDERLELMVSSAIERGDVLVNLPIVNGATKVELIEASRVRTPPTEKNNKAIRSGVMYDSQGEEIGYWVRKLQPNTRVRITNGEYEYIPAFSKFKLDGKNVQRRVATLFRTPLNRRPDQTRTQPLLTPLMPLIRAVSSLIESTVIGARLAASFSIIIRSKNPAGTKEQLEKTNGVKMNNIATMKPGMIALVSGNTESIESPSPNRPFDNTDSFLRRLFRLMSMAIQIPYEMLFLDLSEVNYSSWKGGSMSQKRNIYRWHRDIIAIRNWIQMTWITEDYAKGNLNIHPNRVNITTKMPKFEALDDEKQARADRLDVKQSGLKSKRTAIEDRNLDYEEETREMQEEAMREIALETEQLIAIKKAEEENEIIFPERSQIPEEEDEPTQEGEGDDRDTSKSRRKGEKKGSDLSPEDKKARRRDDGNN